MDPNAGKPDDAPILIAYDGSAHARAAIAAAARLFPARSAIVVSGWRSIEATVPATLIAVPTGVARGAQVKIDAETEAVALDRAEEGAALARELGLRSEAVALKAGGAMWRAIMTSADTHDAAAVVVGSRGLSGMKSAFLGSVSTGLVHHCRRPVVVIREPEEVGP